MSISTAFNAVVFSDSLMSFGNLQQNLDLTPCALKLLESNRYIAFYVGSIESDPIETRNGQSGYKL